MNGPRSAPWALTLLALALAGCATAGPVEEPATLSYHLPATPAVTYAFVDTSTFTIQMGAMGEMEVFGEQEGLAEVEFQADEQDGLRATIGFPRFSARLENPNQGATTADHGDIQGAFTAHVSRRGAVAVTDTPSLTPRAQTVTGVESLVQPLFVRLPDRVVMPGASWVDTVMVVENSGGLRSETQRVVTSTLVGDTVVAGRTLRWIRTEADNRIEVTGVSGGVEIAQRVSGKTHGLVLWDEGRNLLYARHEQGELSGVIDLPGLGTRGLPVNGRVSRSVDLQP